MNCKHCGAALVEGANFCMKCGTKVEKEIHCHACGTLLPEDAGFCFKCGVRQALKGDGEYDVVVSSLDEWVFNQREELIDKNAVTSLMVAEGMTECPNFWGLKSLRRVSLPSTLKRICSKAFCETAVERLEIPDGVTEIGSHAFEACKQLQHVHLPKNLQRISRFAFYDCNEAELCVEYRSCYMHASDVMSHLEEEGIEVIFD